LKAKSYTEKELKIYLDKLYNLYSQKYSSEDPVWLLHNLKNKNDIELLGFVISCFSYGRVELIVSFITKLLNSINNNVSEFILNYKPSKDGKYIKGFYYRFNTEKDLSDLFVSLSAVLRNYQSLENLFLENFNPGEENIIPALSFFTKKINSFAGKKAPASFQYLVPDPGNNSACKRLNLFLRWVVRKDNIDFGLWKNVRKSQLIIPVDVHVFRVSTGLGLINRKSCDLKFAIELTEKLKEFDPEDPVKYDFALCHLGIEKKN